MLNSVIVYGLSDPTVSLAILVLFYQDTSGWWPPYKLDSAILRRVCTLVMPLKSMVSLTKNREISGRQTACRKIWLSIHLGWRAPKIG